MSVPFGANPFSASPELEFHEPDDNYQHEVDDDYPHPADATDDPYHPENFDLDAFDPHPRDYSRAGNFVNQMKREAKGIFTGKVIRACFDGEPRFVENYNYGKPDWEQPPNIPDELPSHLIMMVNEIDDSECYFGLLIDPLNNKVVSGHVLQVSLVEANQVTEDNSNLRLWDTDAIQQMADIVKKHEGKVRNAFIDPPEHEHAAGWIDDEGYEEHNHPNRRFNIPKKLQNQM